MKGRLVKNWDSFFVLFPSELYDVYFQEHYVKLYETANDEAVCFVVEEGAKLFLKEHPELAEEIRGLIMTSFGVDLGIKPPTLSDTDGKAVIGKSGITVAVESREKTAKLAKGRKPEAAELNGVDLEEIAAN